MDRIHYAGDTFVTGTDIAQALLAYAQALAREGSSATVDIPCIHPDGSVSRASVLIGPASQLISEAEAMDMEELEDPETVAALRADAAALGAVRAVALPIEPGSASTTDDLDVIDDE